MLTASFAEIADLSSHNRSDSNRRPPRADWQFLSMRWASFCPSSLGSAQGPSASWPRDPRLTPHPSRLFPAVPLYRRRIALRESAPLVPIGVNRLNRAGLIQLPDLFRGQVPPS
jgi:hypothetical protein